MKQLLFAILVFAFHSCESKKGNNSTKQQAGQSRPVKQLMPYYEVYPYGNVTDQVLKNGTFIRFFANTDTTDGNLYIKYGNNDFESMYVWENGVPATNCRTPELLYGTGKYVALFYQCTNSRGMTLLPLNKQDSVMVYTPIFIDTARELVLFEDYRKYQNDKCFDTLTVADFNFTKQKEFIIAHIVCSNKFSCIDTVYINRKNIVLKSGASTPCDDIHNPEEKTEQTTIPWIKE